MRLVSGAFLPRSGLPEQGFGRIGNPASPPCEPGSGRRERSISNLFTEQ